MWLSKRRISACSSATPRKPAAPSSSPAMRPARSARPTSKPSSFSSACSARTLRYPCVSSAPKRRRKPSAARSSGTVCRDRRRHLYRPSALRREPTRLAYDAEEAERLGHQFIGSEHLLLGILREEILRCHAATAIWNHLEAHTRGHRQESTGGSSATRSAHPSTLGFFNLPLRWPTSKHRSTSTRSSASQSRAFAARTAVPTERRCHLKLDQNATADQRLSFSAATSPQPYRVFSRRVFSSSRARRPKPTAAPRHFGVTLTGTSFPSQVRRVPFRHGRKEDAPVHNRPSSSSNHHVAI